MARDPQWAVRWAKRAVKAFAAVCVLALAGWIGWLVLPEDPAVVELRIQTDAEAFLGNQELGQGDIVLDDDALRAAGVIVPAGSGLAEIAARLYPAEEFRGPIMVDADALPKESAGYQCYFSGDHPRVVRIWVFAIEDNLWLAVPIQFRDAEGRVHTFCDPDETSIGWSVTKSLHKRRFHSKGTNLSATDGTFPGEGETMIGPIELR